MTCTIVKRLGVKTKLINMANQRDVILFSLVLLLCTACGSGTKKPNIPFVENSSEYYDEDVIVPFNDYAGVRTIQVKINNCSEFPMIFDTGCSGMTLSIAEVYVLAKQGCISADDIEGYGYSTIADGSIVQNMIINLKQIQIGDLICHNIRASVSDNENAPLLLGNGVLNQVESFSTDNINKTIKFHLK